MKIAFVNDLFLEGRGADTVIYELARRLGKRHDVLVIATESDFPKENFKIFKIKTNKFLSGNTLKDSFSYLPSLIKFRKGVLKLHKKHNFDIINLHHSSLNPAFLNFPVPVIVTWHGTPPSENKIRTFFNRIVLKSLKKNNLVITISNYMKKSLMESVSDLKIKVIGHGIRDGFEFSKEDGKYILFVGRLEKHKRIHELIKISKNLNFPFVIAGSGPLEAPLKEYSEKIGAEKVIFLGRVSDKKLKELYKGCSFFVSASKWEGFGLIFIEAAACGKPSLGYRKGAIPEVILNRKTGFVVEDFIELRERTRDLIKDEELRRNIGKNAFIFSRGFNWDKSAREYEKLFAEVKNGVER